MSLQILPQDLLDQANILFTSGLSAFLATGLLWFTAGRDPFQTFSEDLFSLRLITVLIL